MWAFDKDEEKVERSVCSLGSDGKPLAGMEFCMKGWLPPYCSELSVVMLEDNGMRKLVEMDDDQVEYRTLHKSLGFCVDGLSGAGVQQFFDGGEKAGGQLVDQRILARIVNLKDEARIKIVEGKLCRIVYKLPDDCV